MKLRVLFLCGGNSCRSQMAEGCLRSLAPDTTQVQSAGVRADGVNPLAVEVMAEKGIDISHHRSKTVPELSPRTFDLVVTLCQPAKNYCAAADVLDETAALPEGPSEKTPVLEGMPLMLHWQIPDPADATGSREQKLEAFRSARDQIQELVEGLINHGLLSTVTEGRQQLESILDLLEDGVFAHDGVHRRIYMFNRAAERITGYSREEVIGRDCHKVFPPDGLCGSQCRFRSDSRESVSRREHTVPFVTRDGTVRQLRITASTTNTATERPGHVVVTFRDITEVSELRGKFKDKYSFENMVGISKSMQSVFESIKQVSISDYPVLISGKSGTGKELVARAIHNQSRRKGAPFVPINCGALPDHILESELFGHVRGAFTGAIRDRKGRFQLADKGTLFLDEVGELSPAFQVKLLRVLQDMRFEQVGGERSINVDVRVISATNRDLRQRVKEGTFRQDLFYRLCVMPIDLPPLRQRREDIPLLVEKTLIEIGEETGKSLIKVADETMDVLIAYHWPGNIRELINALRYATICSGGDEILIHHLPAEVQEATGYLAEREPTADADADADAGPATNTARPRKEKLSTEAVQRALTEAKGNKVLAAKLLKVSRATLYRFLDRNPSL